MKRLKNNNIVKFVIFLSIIGFVLGLLYSTALKPDLSSYLTSFMKNVSTVHINTFLSNLGIITLIFVLSYSVIGLPLPIMYLFIESFSIGYTLGVFIVMYKLKGLLFYSVYFISVKLIYLILIVIFISVCIKATLKLIEAFKEKNKDQLYKTIKYSFIRLALVLLISLINSTLIYFLANKLVSLV